MSITVILAVVFVVFLGALTRTTFGFGEAVISMPLLALLPVHLHTSISLIGLAGLTVALIVVTTGWRHLNRDALIPLVLAALIGIPIGLVMIHFVPTKIITELLGIALVCYGTYSLIRHLFTSKETEPKLTHRLWGLLFGFISGVLGSAYNFNGVPVAVYGSLRRWHPEKFRSIMQAYFLISGIFIVAGQGISGMWNSNVLILYLSSLPALATAIIVGTILNRRIPTEKFQRYVFFLITVLGTVLFVKSVI